MCILCGGMGNLVLAPFREKCQSTLKESTLSSDPFISERRTCCIYYCCSTNAKHSNNELALGEVRSVVNRHLLRRLCDAAEEKTKNRVVFREKNEEGK